MRERTTGLREGREGRQVFEIFTGTPFDGRRGYGPDADSDHM
jgi:hypothetical protein